MIGLVGSERGRRSELKAVGEGGQAQREPAPSPCWWTPPALLTMACSHHHGLRRPPDLSLLFLHSPVAFPGVADMRVVNAMLIGLLIQEVKHVLDGQGQGGAAVRGAEDGLEQVVHKLLQRALGRRAHKATQLRRERSGRLCNPPRRLGRGDPKEPASLGEIGEAHVLNFPPLHLSLTALHFRCSWEMDTPLMTGPKQAFLCQQHGLV